MIPNLLSLSTMKNKLRIILCLLAGVTMVSGQETPPSKTKGATASITATGEEALAKLIEEANKN